MGPAGKSVCVCVCFCLRVCVCVLISGHISSRVVYCAKKDLLKEVWIGDLTMFAYVSYVPAPAAGVAFCVALIVEVWVARSLLYSLLGDRMTESGSKQHIPRKIPERKPGRPGETQAWMREHPTTPH